MSKTISWILSALAIRGGIGVAIFGAVYAIRRAKKGSAGAAAFGWVSLFFGAGINPQPPPQEQVETANRQRKIKKTEAGGDPE
jgi:hypothetical protein